MGHAVVVRPVEGHRVDPADRELGRVEGKTDGRRIGGVEQRDQLLLRVEALQAVVVQRDPYAGSRGDLADTVPQRADDGRVVGAERRCHPGRARRPDDELLAPDRAEHLDERLRRLDDRVVVRRVAGHPERVAGLLGGLPRVPGPRRHPVHAGPGQEGEQPVGAAVVDLDDPRVPEVLPATAHARGELDVVEPQHRHGLQGAELVLVAHEDVHPEVPGVDGVGPAQRVLHSPASASRRASASTLSMYHFATHVASA